MESRMADMPNNQLDATSLKILAQLQRDARLSYAELGRRVGLSTPAVAERVRRMEESGVIRGYEVRIHAPALGLEVTAFVRIRLSGGETRAQRLTELASELPEVLECHRCTGDESFILKVRVKSVGRLAELIDRLNPFGMTSTSLILSSPLERSSALLNL
jgi:Lrp/AsnC family transcriptional regulator, leucine-responsive regulatory protein